MGITSGDEFQYDVFLSHSAKDKDVVREIANRLKSDGVRVWFDDWEIKPGDSIPAKIEDGLEHSRVLVLCMSAQALAADWAQLESHTFRFKDPLNHDRRFIPLRLDDAPLKGSLAQFLYISWLPQDREHEYPKLLDACRLPTMPAMPKTRALGASAAEISYQLKSSEPFFAYAFSPDGSHSLSAHNTKLRLWNVKNGNCDREFEEAGRADFVAWSADRRLALSGGRDNKLRLWDVETGHCTRGLEGHSSSVWDVALHAVRRIALSSSFDGTIRLWDLETGSCVRVFEGHTSAVRQVKWSADHSFALSGADDNTVRLWDIKDGRCLKVFTGHTYWVLSVAWSPDQQQILSGSCDNTMRLWSAHTGQCLRVFEGHTSNVEYIAWSADQRLAVSGSPDNTVRLWDIQTGHCLCVFEGHKSHVRSLTWSADGRRAFSGDMSGGIRVWDLSEFVTKAETSSTISAPSGLDQVQYTNAKVLLVGNSAAGKTGLSNRLALGTYKETDSTVGAWATQWKLPLETKDGVEREIWLWDFGGQADQRLIHQLYMDQTHLAALVFDPQKEDLFDTLGTWDRDLTRAATKDFQKLLVAGRTDTGGLRTVSKAKVEEFAKERGFARYIETSAKENVGCEELKTAIVELINWDQMTKRTSPVLFKRLKEEIVRLKEEGRVLMRFNELRDALALRMSSMGPRPVEEDDGGSELKTVISLLAGPGVVWELGFGTWILLQSELINSHAQAVIRCLREDEREIGCIAETQVLSGDLAFPKENRRLEPGEERIVLLAMHQILIDHGLCLRDEDPEQKRPTMLVFPSYARRERPDLVAHPSVIVSYQFNGFLDDIYATLVVRLHHTQPFDRDQLWRDAADFKTIRGRRLGVKLTRRADGAGELEVYFDPEIPVKDMMVFSKYVHEHLLKKAKDVVRLRHYVCSHEYKASRVKPKQTAKWRWSGWRRRVSMPRLTAKDVTRRWSCGTNSKGVLRVRKFNRQFASWRSNQRLP